jgi:hypothetical protein
LLASSASETKASGILLHPVERRIVVSHVLLSVIYPPIAQFSIIKNLPVMSHLVKYNLSDRIYVKRDELALIDKNAKVGDVTPLYILLHF